MGWVRNVTRPFRRGTNRWLDRRHRRKVRAGSRASRRRSLVRRMRAGVAELRHFFGYVTKKLESVLPIRFIKRWSRSRDYRLLLKSIPALLAGTVLTGGAVVATFSIKSTTADHYVNRAIAAKRAGNDDVVELFLRKANGTAAGTHESRFNQALLLQSIDKESDAYAIMKQLAPDDSPGFIPAHEWRIRWMSLQVDDLAKKETELTKQEHLLRSHFVQQIEQQLKLIVEIDPDHLNANKRLAAISISHGKPEDAIDHISQIVDRHPESRVTYAKLLAETDRINDATTQANVAREFHEKRLMDESLSAEEKWQNRLRLSQAYVILENYESAAKSLTENGAVPESIAVRRALANVIFLWSRSIDAQDGNSLIRRLNMLNQALQLDPSNQAVLKAVAMIAGERGEPGVIAAQTIKDVLSTGHASPIVHFVLASNAAAENDLRKAKMHLELAHDASPNLPIVLNNLAFVIASEDEPDLDRALALANQAISLSPSTSNFYDTRGSIHTKLGRWKDAIGDLEKALKSIPNRPSIHRKLAACYEAMGDSDLAGLHRARAEQKEKAAKNERAR